MFFSGGCAVQCCVVWCGLAWIGLAWPGLAWRSGGWGWRGGGGEEGREVSGKGEGERRGGGEKGRRVWVWRFVLCDVVLWCCAVWCLVGLGWAVLGWVGLGWVVWCGAVRCGGLGLVANNTKSKCLRLWRPRAYVDDHDVFSVEPPTDASEPFQNLSTWCRSSNSRRNKFVVHRAFLRKECLYPADQANNISHADLLMRSTWHSFSAVSLWTLATHQGPTWRRA